MSGAGKFAIRRLLRRREEEEMEKEKV